MIRLLIFCLFWITVCYAVDHKVFKNCSNVEFCSNLRNRELEDKYRVSHAKVEESVAFLTLTTNDDTDNLILTITSLYNDTFRINITEESSDRFKLVYVLDGEPVTKPFTEKSVSEDRYVFATDTNKVIITNSPLKIVLLKNDEPIVVMNGERLILENDNTSRAFAFSVSFPQAVQIYGIHEHAENLALQNTTNLDNPYRLRNMDVAGYELYSPMAVYGAVPVLYGHGPSYTSGIFLHNAAEQWFEIINSDNNGSEAYIMVETGVLDLFVLFGPKPEDVVHEYLTLTGTSHLPQLWTLGYHQCRWNYDNVTDVENVIDNFDKNDFPLDAIWLDIEYTDGKRYFTWNPENFTNPLEMQQYIASKNRKLVTIIDPHIKVDEDYPVYTGAREKDLFVKNSNGYNFEGDCWPGLSSYMDFLNPAARDYYANWYSYDKFVNSTPTLAGIWNDMNEPSVFDDSLEKTLPGDALHFGNVKHRDLHNIYGLLHTMSTHQGLIERDNGTKRPFILTRSHFAGSQRYAAIWTGDNTVGWGYLAISYPQCLNANMMGIVFCGADIGGFDGNPDQELLQRWYQAGVWLPFYRSHANEGTQRREPYLFPKDVQQVIRNALRLRYQHLPTWYTLFYEYTRNKDPIILPLFYQYPQDRNVYKINTQLLVGGKILVRAVTEPGATSVQVYFPGGSDVYWYALNSTKVYLGQGYRNISVDIQSIPVYYKGGSVVVRKDTPRASSTDMLNDGYTLYLNLDKEGQASGTVYIDDYQSFEYVKNQRYLYLNITKSENKTIITRIDDSNHEGFEFKIDAIVVNSCAGVTGEDGDSLTYKQTVFKQDVDGNALKDLKFDFKANSIVEIQIE